MWTRLGVLRRENWDNPSLLTHMSVPIVEPLEFPKCRIFFSARDSNNRSRTYSSEFEITSLHRGLLSTPQLVLDVGELGAFDDSGAMATWLLSRGTDRYLYFIGWNLGVTVPFRNSLGLAISRGDGPFEKTGPGPVLDRCYEEPHFVASAAVIPSSMGNRIYYLSCTGWVHGADGPMHRYHIKSTTSSDGIHWVRPGTIAIDYQDESEYAISRPSVLVENSLWRMWFSVRGHRYQIGYAESADGVNWTRKDAKCGLTPTGVGLETEMVAYPHVFRWGADLYMAYNGDGYGRDGVVFAVWE